MAITIQMVSLMPNRHASSGDYRYGFNGQESDGEIKGEGNHYTATFWEYDPRTARRWNLDPVVKPWESGSHSKWHFWSFFKFLLLIISTLFFCKIYSKMDFKYL